MSTKNTILGIQENDKKVTAPQQQQTQQPSFDFSQAEGTSNAEAQTVSSAKASPYGPTNPTKIVTEDEKIPGTEGIAHDFSTMKTAAPSPAPKTAAPVKHTVQPNIGNDAAVPAVDANGNAIAPRMTYQKFLEENSPYKKPTPEELAKEQKKQKRDQIFAAIGDGISSLSNLYFTTKGAPNMYDPKSNASQRVQERYDKINKEREANSQAFFNQMLQAKKWDEEADQKQKEWKNMLKQQQENKDYRDKRDKVADDQWQQGMDYKKDRDKVEDNRWEKQFNESKRQFSVSSAQSAQRISLESQRLAKEMQNGNVTFSLGSGKGNVSLPSSSLNAQTVGSIFSKLPKEVQDTVHGDPIFNKLTGAIEGYGQPSVEAMLIAIGTNVDGQQSVQDALLELAGKKKASKGTGYGSGGSSNGNRGY